ncbi:hypothetical protein [Hymenobacter canadensis]|uniref:Uncharacterized protein n=1 Tax=Hymenobacter canadensis TaxID=2999067 RepID=A0ABY7LV38_9BACT|nr:hypothetical protein [Hymenobacter canadensis]WBA43970.1 hypothetical protein O3303_20610 [Hymenobacter canadensis]WBA44252.1 hypothetical protein O3303_21490 [Hymenobacter canadensis]
MLHQPALPTAQTPRGLRLTCLLGLLGAQFPGWAQEAPTPLHAFLQQHYDSTIVYHVGSSWYNAPNYIILAKHRGGVDAFTYANPYRDGLGHYYPGQLVRHFSKEDTRFRATRPDTNRYLVPRAGDPAELRRAWQQLHPTRFWSVRGDGERPATPASCFIDDGPEHVFYLLDKRAIRVVRFYAPQELQDCEDARQDPGRAQALATIQVLQALIPRVR